MEVNLIKGDGTFDFVEVLEDRKVFGIRVTTHFSQVVATDNHVLAGHGHGSTVSRRQNVVGRQH